MSFVSSNCTLASASLLKHFPQQLAPFNMFLSLILSFECHSKHLPLLPQLFLYSHEWQQLTHLLKNLVFFSVSWNSFMFLFFFPLEMHNPSLKHLCSLSPTPGDSAYGLYARRSRNELCNHCFQYPSCSRAHILVPHPILAFYGLSSPQLTEVEKGSTV